MNNFWRNIFILMICLLVAIWAIVPPEKKLRRGKDLAGGASLVYAVTVNPGETDVLPKVIQVVKERLDPNGVMEISVVGVGSDRIEVTMPLPNDRVKKLKSDYEGELAKLATGAITADELSRIAALPAEQRTTEATRLAGTDAERRARLDQAFKAYDDLRSVRAGLNEVDKAQRDAATQAENLAKTVAPDDPALKALRDAAATLARKYEERVNDAAALELAFEGARDAALSKGLNPGELRRALNLPDKDVRIQGEGNTTVTLPSPRKRALQDIYDKYPSQKPQVETAIASWNKYESERRGLDDPQDLVRILRGAGVLNFRITVDAGALPEEPTLREQLRNGGPRAVRSDEARWYKINKIENWVKSEKDLEALKASPSQYFSRYGGYIVDEYKGEYYMLCWDRRGVRLTEKDGDWRLDGAFQGQDQLGRPAIDFRMNASGADKLGELTGANVGKKMAVLLDDEVYTAPTLQSRISNQGQITGNFSAADINYVIRVLSAGSLQAKLSPDPISTSVLGPQLGADNLARGLRAGMIAFIIVGAFMVCYYFTCGLVSVLALIVNLTMLLGAMALNQAAFTLPGIAGVILTFGMAVDANVLIYERMREELNLGHDLKTAVRLGYQRALTAIIDGHITTLIVCVVLVFTGTQEIKGFALTLGIGVVSTLFAQLFFTRFLFAILVDRFRIKRLSMLPMAFPKFQKMLHPNIDWMHIRGYSYIFSAIIAGMGVFFLFYEGADLLGTEFRGGTAVTLTFKEEGGVPVKMNRSEVEKRVRDVADRAPAGSPLKDFQYAEVLAVNPDADNITSNTFTIRSLITDAPLVQTTLASSFADKLESRRAVRFEGVDQRPDRGAPVFPITTPVLGDSIDRPDVRIPSGEYYNGLAIVLANIDPPMSLAELKTRLAETRAKASFSDTLGRTHDAMAIDGSNAAVHSAVVLVQDPNLPYAPGDTRWASDVRDREWRLAHEAVAENQTLASVEQFSPAVAKTFRAQAIVAVLLSTLMIVIYVWVRFNSLRYSVAAIACTLHDCLVAIGFVALATVVYRNMPGVAATLGILPFKVDLNVVAAVMTILGYSLNDTIIVMDRIRENRGKLPYASRAVINDSINQTVSRTLITAGTTFLATMTLYIFGGEGVRVFAYTMLIGILVGTYSSIAVAAPLVWVKAVDPHGAEADAQGGRGGAPRGLAARAKTAA